MIFSHTSVLPEECINGLNIKPDGIYFDCTAGGGGHSARIAKHLKSGTLVAIDQDPDAIKAATKALEEFACAKVVKSNFSEIDSVARELCISEIDGVLFDLGVSSHQLDEASRGFSYKREAPLDMRMSQNGLSAGDVVNTYSEAELSRILFEYGEERYARNIARNIIKNREIAPIETTLQLAEIIASSVPASVRRDKNPSKRSFQAIRIEVNKELDCLSEGLEKVFSLLKSGGRICVISFHSLEDRLVKQKFAGWCKGCTCPPDFPQCICGNKPKARLVSKKPILPANEELKENSRSASAKLRVLEKL